MSRAETSRAAVQAQRRPVVDDSFRKLEVLARVCTCVLPAGPNLAVIPAFHCVALAPPAIDVDSGTARGFLGPASTLCQKHRLGFGVRSEHPEYKFSAV